jgi:hypothetical protein
MDSLKPDCQLALQRKKRQSVLLVGSGTLSLVRFVSICRIAAISSALSRSIAPFSAVRTEWRRGRDSITAILTEEILEDHRVVAHIRSRLADLNTTTPDRAYEGAAESPGLESFYEATEPVQPDSVSCAEYLYGYS